MTEPARTKPANTDSATPGATPSDTQTQRFHLRIRDFFYAMVLVAMIAFALSRFGYESISIWIALALSTGFTVFGLSVLLSRQPKWVTPLTVVSIIIFLCVGFMVFPLILNAVAFGLITVAHLNFKLSKGKTVRLATASLALTFLIYSFIPSPRLTRVLELRKKYPIEDLSARLEYEQKSGRSVTLASQKTDSKYSNSIYENYVNNLDGHSYRNRNRSLKRFHDREYEKFVRTIGFGTGRMGGFDSEADVWLPAVESIQPGKPGTSNDPNYSEFVDWFFTKLDEQFPDHSKSRDGFHEAQFFDFLYPESIGWVSDRQKAAGFRPHSFRAGGFGFQEQAENQPLTQWNLTRLQLVSLRRFDEPRVYLHEQLPSMELLADEDVPMRAITEFERRSLEKLAAGSEVESQQSDRQLLMVGALRASKTCLQCHSGSNGTLLGAFTYEFERVKRP